MSENGQETNTWNEPMRRAFLAKLIFVAVVLASNIDISVIIVGNAHVTCDGRLIGG